ncbi:MAG: 16S rRNA (cytosine(967)-C(5))-methyltransferase RsmB [Lentisphaerae bacterium]|nr:16S rRNA (cytosine(967)-C(5))-methyltransferase RsmB [Lentisphaerota bacterium]
MTDGASNARGVAAAIVGRWLDTGDFPDRQLETVERDRAFIMEVVYGVARRRRTLEWVLGRYVRRPPGPEVLPYVLVGLYQVLMMDRVAGYAAVSETVEAVKRMPRPAAARGTDRRAKAAGFVNAVLRRALREADDIEAGLARQPAGIRLSHPDWLVQRWTRRYGESGMLRLCEWNNTRPDVALRVNSLQTDADAFRAALAAEGVAAAPHPVGGGAWLTVKPSLSARGLAPAGLPGYLDGWFTVQDPSTGVAVELLDPRPGERVLDACAAPGGKTVLIAERLRGRGRVVALDRHADRLERLIENLERLRLAGFVEPVQGDATRGADLSAACGDTPFDRILLDVPCTNTGVLRRRPDARWRVSRGRIGRLAALQRAMLDNAVPFLKPGGILVYSTCSLEPEEGEAQIAGWLRERRDFRLVNSKALFPPESRCDGVYAAALRRG